MTHLTRTMALALGAAILALVVAAGASAQTCTSETCLMTLQSVSPVADGCGEHARPGRVKLTLASSQPVTYNAGKTGRYAERFPTRTVTVPVDPADETRSRNDFPITVFAEIGRDTVISDDVFQDWEWRNENSNRGQWQRVSPRRWGVTAPDVGEHIYEVRPVAGARIWGNYGEMMVGTLQMNPVSNATSSGNAYFLFMGGKGCARVNHAGQTDGTIQ